MSCDEIEVPMVKKTEGRIPILTLLGNSVIGSKENFLHLEISQQGGRWWGWRVEEVGGSGKLGALYVIFFLANGRTLNKNLRVRPLLRAGSPTSCFRSSSLVPRRVHQGLGGRPLSWQPSRDGPSLRAQGIQRLYCLQHCLLDSVFLSEVGSRCCFLLTNPEGL